MVKIIKHLKFELPDVELQYPDNLIKFYETTVIVALGQHQVGPRKIKLPASNCLAVPVTHGQFSFKHAKGPKF